MAMKIKQTLPSDQLSVNGVLKRRRRTESSQDLASGVVADEGPTQKDEVVQVAVEVRSETAPDDAANPSDGDPALLPDGVERQAERDGSLLLAQATGEINEPVRIGDSPSSVGEDLLRQARPAAVPDPVPRPAAPPAPAAAAVVSDLGDDETPWHESMPLWLGAAALGVFGVSALAKSPAPAPAQAPTSPDVFTFRVLPMAGEMTGLRVVVVDASGLRRELDPSEVERVANSNSGELKVTVKQFGQLAAGTRLKIELHDDNGAAANFDDEANPAVGYDTDLGPVVLSAWVSKAPAASNELAGIGGSTMSLAITPLSTVAARHLDGLMGSHPELFADAAKADETIATIHQSVAALFSSLGSFPLVQNAQPKPVNADWTSTPDAYGRALGVLSKLATRSESLGIDGVIRYLTTHLRDSDVVGRGVTLDTEASALLKTVSDAYFATTEVSAAIQANLASISLRRRTNAGSSIGEQVDAAGVVAHTSLSDGLTVAIMPAKGARAGDKYLLRFHPEGASGSAGDYTQVYTLPADFDATSTTLPLLHKVPVFRDNLTGQGSAPLVEYAKDASGNTLLAAGRAMGDISRFKLSIEPGPGMRPDFVLPPVDLAIDHEPVAIVSAPVMAGSSQYHVGETILVKVVLPSKVAWNISTNGVHDVRTYAPRLKLKVGDQTVEATLVDPVVANGSNVLLFGHLVTRIEGIQGEISLDAGALLANGDGTSIRDVSGGRLPRAFNLLVDTTLRDTGQGVDGSLPLTPTLRLQVVSDTGTVGDGVTSVAQVRFDVQGEPLSRVDLTDASGTRVGSVLLDENGRGVLITRALGNTAAGGTEHVLTAVAFDKAGNESLPSSPQTLRIDNRAPNRPLANLLADDDTGLKSDDGVTRSITPRVRIVGEADTQAVVFIDANGNRLLDAGEMVQGRGKLVRPDADAMPPGLTLTTGQGVLDLVLKTNGQPLPDGRYGLTVLTTDAADNSSPALAMPVIQVLSQQVKAPVLALSTTVPEGDFLEVGGKVRITATFERAVHVQPSGDAGAAGPSVTLRLDASTVVQAGLVDGSGSSVLTFEYVVRAKDNSPGLSFDAAALSLGGAAISDVAGNPVDLATRAVAAHATAPLRIDTLLPDAPASAWLDAASDTGDIGDGRTSDSTPQFIVRGEAGATVVLFNDVAELDRLEGNTELGRVVLGKAAAGQSLAEGLLSLAGDLTLADGIYERLKVVQIDAAGNVSNTQRVRGSITRPELVIATDRPGLLSGLDFDEAMDRRSVTGEGLAQRDHYTYIATPAFNFQGGTLGNGVILFRDIDGDARFDPKAGDIELGRSTITSDSPLSYSSVSVSASQALAEGVYADIRAIQVSAAGVLADRASGVAPSLRISPNAPGPLGLELQAGQTFGNATQVSFDLTPDSYVEGARVFVFEDINGNGALDAADPRLGSAGGDLPVLVMGRPVLSLPAPAEGSYARLMAYQVYAGKTGAASVVGAQPEEGITLDRTGPKLTISSDVFVLDPGTSTQLTLTFDEEPRPGSFSLDRLIRSDDRLHATLGELSAIVPVDVDGRTVWQATVTLSADGTGVAVFTLEAPAGAFQDRHGNASRASLFELSGVTDEIQPTVTITSDVAKVGLAGRDPATQARLTFTMSEAVSDFTLDDISVYGGADVGSLAELRPVDGQPLQWTALFTPAIGTVAEARISVRNGAVFDLRGNSNDPASIRLAVDTAASPVVLGPDAWANVESRLTVAEDTRLALRSTTVSSGATAISVRDDDVPGSASAFDRIELTVGLGRLRVDLAGSATVLGNDSATLTLTGTVAQVNAALATLSYLGNPDANGIDSLTAAVMDLTGKTDRKTWVIDVQPVNDAPQLVVPGNEATTVVAGTAAVLSGIRTDDVDSLTVKTVISAGNGQLSAGVGDGGASLSGIDTAELTISGTPADVRAAIATLTFTPDGNFHALNPAVQTSTIRVVTTDAEGLLASRSFTVKVSPRTFVAPVIIVSPSLSEEGIVTREDVASVPLGTGRITVFDGDPDGSASALSSLTLSVERGTLTLRHAGSTLRGSTLTLHGNATSLQDALASLTYQDLAHAHGDGAMTLIARDAEGNEARASVALHVASVGDAPVVTLPVSPSGLETGKTSSLAGIKVSDVDVGVGALSGVTVSVMHGRLAVTAPAPGGSDEVMPEVTPSASGLSISMTGTQTQLQALLDTLTYTPDASVFPRPSSKIGRDWLTVSASDGDSATSDPLVALPLSVQVPNLPATGDIGVQGVARVGENLSIRNTLADPDGIVGGLSGFAYTWLRDGVAVSPAVTGRTYTLTDADLQHVLSVEVRFTDLRGQSTLRTSIATAPVESDRVLGLAQAVRFADATLAPVSSAQLILSRHGSGFDDFVLDVNGDGLIDRSDRTAYISSLDVNSLLMLGDGRRARLLSQDDWGSVTGVPLDWPVPGADAGGYWTSTPGVAGSHVVHLGSGTASPPGTAADVSGSHFNVFRVEAVL